MDAKWGELRQAGTCGHELEPMRMDQKPFVFCDDVGVLQEKWEPFVGVLNIIRNQ